MAAFNFHPFFTMMLSGVETVKPLFTGDSAYQYVYICTYDGCVYENKYQLLFVL